MIVYKGYDQEALDKQYNNRARVPGFAQVVEQWREWSTEARLRLPIAWDIRYGPGDRQLLDIIPADRSGSPVQVFFHGGYWQSMDKGLFHFIADGFTDYGASTVVVNYPLAPQASMDEIVASCSQAVVWLYRHGREYGMDADRMYLSGHSAGGHIAAMLMATNWRELDKELPPDLLKGACAVSGLFDLTPIRLSYLNEILGLDELAARRNSPVLLSPACTSPLLLSVGELESEEYRAQSRALSEAWCRSDESITLLTLPAQDHFSIVEQLARKEGALNRKVIEQMGLRKW